MMADMAEIEAARPVRIHCREIADADFDSILDLVSKSPFGRPREFWQLALQRLASHATPDGFPRYGYLLEVNGIAAGMVLMVSSRVAVDGVPKIRSHFSTWYVWPAFRAYALPLAMKAASRKDATYVDISPMGFTFELLKAMGYERYCEGRFTSVPALSIGPRARIVRITPDRRPEVALPPDEIRLLLDHAALGHFALVASLGDRHYPFVFEPNTRHRLFRSAYLVYCRSMDDFVRFAGPLGRSLLRRGITVVQVDANGHVSGLVGWYRPATPKYFRGPDRPRLGDLAYSERAVLGLRFPARVEVPEE
jgi:hypothetical protein